MASAKEPVAFLGIGTMGHGLAANALRAGIPTIVWNRDGGATRDLADGGASVAKTAADAARQAGIVVTMVTDADAVLSIAGDQGMLAALGADAVWVQMSTIGVAGIERVQALVDSERPDVTLVDAPVSGSKEPAAQGQLTVFASGPDGVHDRLDPLFDAVGQRTIWVGRVGGGGGEHLGGPVPSPRTRDGDCDRRVEWEPAGVPLADSEAATNRQGRL